MPMLRKWLLATHNQVKQGENWYVVLLGSKFISPLKGLWELQVILHHQMIEILFDGVFVMNQLSCFMFYCGKRVTYVLQLEKKT